MRRGISESCKFTKARLPLRLVLIESLLAGSTALGWSLQLDGMLIFKDDLIQIDSRFNT